MNAFPVPAEQTHLTHPKYRADIDGLRAIAVLSVVGFHAFPLWIRGGFVGVDIFFVISGFLISSIIISSLEKGTFSFAEFYARRIKRIFPALILVMAACYVFGWFTLLPDEYKQLGKHIAAGAGFVSNFFFWQEAGYFDNAALTKPLLHLWSLGIEEQFYIVWPLLLYFAWQRRFNFLILTVTIIVISFSVNVNIRLSDRVQDFYSPLTRFWELMMGSILGYLTLQKLSLWEIALQMFRSVSGKVGTTAKSAETLLRNAQSVLGALLICIAMLLVTKERLFPGWWALLPTVGAFLIISAGQHAWLNRTLLSHRIMVWFGLISYPLYLWHWPLLSFASMIFEGETPAEARGIRIAAVLISIVLAWLTYRLVEKPIRIGKHSKAKSITLFALMVVVGYVGYNCYMREGLGFRFPKIIQELTQQHVDKEDEHANKEEPMGFCFLNPEQDYSFFKACEYQIDEGKKQSLLIWGDSNAGHLQPGYIASFGENYKITTLTASSCPPILNLEFPNRPFCKEINDYIFEFIKREKPNKIVLEAIWNEYDWKKISVTIDRLHEIGITNIDLIGPVPRWIDGLPKQLYLRFKADISQQIPYRMKSGLKQNVFQLEPLMSDFAKQLGVNYISPTKILCNEFGCITRLGETKDTLTAFDEEHLTDMGSRFLVSQFPRN